MQNLTLLAGSNESIGLPDISGLDLSWGFTSQTTHDHLQEFKTTPRSMAGVTHDASPGTIISKTLDHINGHADQYPYLTSICSTILASARAEFPDQDLGYVGGSGSIRCNQAGFKGRLTDRYGVVHECQEQFSVVKKNGTYGIFGSSDHKDNAGVVDGHAEWRMYHNAGPSSVVMLLEKTFMGSDRRMALEVPPGWGFVAKRSYLVRVKHQAVIMLNRHALTSIRIIMSLKTGGIKTFTQRPASAYPSSLPYPSSSSRPQSAPASTSTSLIPLPLLQDGRIDTRSIQDYSFLNQGDSSAGGLASTASHGPQMANGGLASVASHGPQMANGGLASIASHGPQMGNAGAPLGVMHSADAMTHHNGGHNSAAGKCAKCWTIDTAIRHHHWMNCPHRNKPKLTDTQKKQATAAMKKEEEDDY